MKAATTALGGLEMGLSAMSGLRDRLDAVASSSAQSGAVRDGPRSLTANSNGENDALKGGAGSKQIGLVSDAIAARLKHRPDPVKPNMPKSARGDAGSVRASMAKRLSMMKLYGKAGSGSAGGGKAGATAGGTKAQQALYVSTSQRVVVKAFVSRHVLTGTPRGGSALSKHLHYLVRDGVGYEGQSPEIFDARSDHDSARLDGYEKALEIGSAANGQGRGTPYAQGLDQDLDSTSGVTPPLSADTSLMDQCASWERDRHHFRFIVSPEHGDRIKDMPAYTRAVMADVAADLKEPNLQWVGICHYDTDQPHAHIVVRGKRANGRDLVIPRRYIAYGMRNRAQEQATVVLGEISRTQAEKDLFARTMSDRWTDIDAKLTRVAQHHGGIFPNQELDRTDTYGSVMRGRARHLEALGLATRTSEGLVLAGEMRQKLDGLAIKLGDEKFDIWHEAVRAKGKDGPAKVAEKVVEAEVLKIDIEAARPESVHEAKPARQAQQTQVHIEASPPEPQVNPYDDQITARYLTKLDITLEQRGQSIAKGERPTYYAKPVEEALEARGEILVREGLAVDHGAHVSIKPEGWNQLRQADLARAVSEQLGLSTDRLGQVHRCDEGRIVGHVSTALGQFTIADRGVGLVAFKSTPGLELSVGLELGGGLER
jgi:type IV secretory pathway VirD2 relaxase